MVLFRSGKSAGTKAWLMAGNRMNLSSTMPDGGLRPRIRKNSGAGQTMAARRLFAAAAVFLMFSAAADGRELTSRVTDLDQLPRVRPEYPVPNEPNMLFYIERSVNSNTVVYAANLDSHGRIDPDTPIIAYWRWYNVDGHRKPLNFAERMLAYGIKSVTHDGPGGSFTFKLAALPERTIFVDLDSKGLPEAFGKVGNRWARLVYVYLEVDDSGLVPDVTAMDFFGYDKHTGKPLREHITPH